MNIEKFLNGALLLESKVLYDERGCFFESYKKHTDSDYPLSDFTIRQTNASRSKSGTLRGIHFSNSPLGQAKLVTCTNGSMIDFLIDLRADSPTFLEFRTIELQMFDGKTVFIPAGFGHAFLALENDTVINYSLSSTYSPREEFCIYPLDMMFRDVWGNVEIILSERDRSAPTLQEALELGIIGPNLSTNTTKQSR